ncbi:hypothetical protein [Streptomyces stelliscabiei]|uniref:Uncharacterized protein n=1 Tax=Streptomyces stelliscabiei TaxID=146820 RepID=A0A8I0PDW8_9ACTN|nr:hypothetical protein [Streptomyces stelliscabiei]MBE1603100.1 hypothetical protein [Streptomyces stelliscabiei]MDX2522393.1 hypothetical protein [Streptomyces stelliscabiei]
MRNSPTNPHVRGEDGDYFFGSREELGRPPPMWGGPRIVQLAALLYG